LSLFTSGKPVPRPAPITPETALDAGFTAEATAWAIATSFCRRYGVSAARQLIDVMGRAISDYERKSKGAS
jgi:hypothetical protein